MAKANIVTLFKLLQKYDGEKSMTLGHWRIGRGGYDLEFEIYVKVDGHEITFAEKYTGEGFEECGDGTAKSICGYDFDVIEPVIKQAYNSRYDIHGVYDWKHIWSAFLKEHKSREKLIVEKYK